MEDIQEKIEEKLPADCQEALDSGRAIIKFKHSSFCVIDDDESDLFDVLPLIVTRYGFAISIPYKRGYLTTNLAEIICRKKGKVIYLNGCIFDLRADNLQIEPWVKTYDKVSESNITLLDIENSQPKNKYGFGRKIQR